MKKVKAVFTSNQAKAIDFSLLNSIKQLVDKEKKQKVLNEFDSITLKCLREAQRNLNGAIDEFRQG